MWLGKSLEETLVSASVQVARRLHRAEKMGAWMTIQPSTVNRTELGVQEC